MTYTKPCARCGKQNSAEIHTCTPLALRLAEQLEDTESARLHLLPYVAAELLEALHRANSLLAELSFSSWIPGSEAASADMRQRILNTHRYVFDAITKVEGPVQGESVVG